MIIGIVGYAGDGKTLLSVIYTTHLIYGNPVKENLMLLVMAAGFGVLMGIIIGLAIGHVRI